MAANKTKSKAFFISILKSAQPIYKVSAGRNKASAISSPVTYGLLLIAVIFESALGRTLIYVEGQTIISISYEISDCF